MASLLRPPAVRALFLQIAAVIVNTGILFILGHTTEVDISLFGALLLQGGVSVLLSYWCGLAIWWLPIQFFFPFAMIGTQALALPPSLFLFLFLLLLGLYWSTFRTQVPYFPSGLPTWELVASILPKETPIKFIDIGSGFGGLVLYLSALRSESTFMGIEIAPIPWCVSRLRGKRGQFLLGNYDHLDLRAFDVVFAFLSPVAMPEIWAKARREMRPGSLLLSYEFIIPDAKPDIVLNDHRNVMIYAWRL
jgi:hypothetical protein